MTLHVNRTAFIAHQPLAIRQQRQHALPELPIQREDLVWAKIVGAKRRFAVAPFQRLRKATNRRLALDYN